MSVLAGVSLIYFLCLLFAIYQKYEDIKEVMYWLYPDLRHWKPDEKVCMYWLGYSYYKDSNTIRTLI